MERINILGAGLSGLSAAIRLAESGRACSLISSQPSERAQSVLAAGGINAVMDLMGEHDTVAEHYADTMRGGAYLADPRAVKGLTDHAPEIVRWLITLGVPFQMDHGNMIQRNFGGQKKKRTAFARSSTGKILMTALIDCARKYEAEGLIRRYPRHEFVMLLPSEEGACLGIRIRDRFTGEGTDLYGRTIICSGGLNGLFPGMTTGTTQNSGNAAAALFVQGIRMANLEFIQYHPTTFAIPDKRCLISEAARGEGGRLCVMRGTERWYFMEELYPELGNLMPRDVISREIYRVVRREDCGSQVFLDMTHLPDDTWKKKLPDLRDECLHYLNIDPAGELVPVEPGIHYFMGGIDVDPAHRTNIPGLYAAGECACQYHGANRLGGNSMLGAIYGGRTAAEDILSQPEWAFPANEELLGILPQPETADGEQRALVLRNILRDAMGIERCEAELLQGIAALDRLLEADPPIQERARILLGKAMVMSALSRRESRGAHTRTDYPDKDDVHFHTTTLASFEDDAVCIGSRPVPETETAE